MKDATDYLAFGIMGSILAAALGVGAWQLWNPGLGYAVGAALGLGAWTILTIGIIAKGVQVGNRS